MSLYSVSDFYRDEVKRIANMCARGEISDAMFSLGKLYQFSAEQAQMQKKIDENQRTEK
jgi:hypothetical protein